MFAYPVDDVDSLDAYADALERAGITESYGDYCARMADELAAEWAEDHPDEDEEPEPPTPAAPALRPLPAVPCTVCHGYGRVPMVPPTAHSGAPCWYCGGGGGGADRDPAPVAATDRTDHMRRIGQTGGLVTFDRYGRTFYRTIGKAGYAATKARHGERYAQDLLRAKGWTPRRPDLLADLAAGRELAELAAAA